MTDIRFYHLQRMPLERALPRLLLRVLESGARAVVLAGSPERVESLDMALWTFDQGSFLPHGTVRDGRPEVQPVWLTAEDENPNGASVLVLTDGARSARMADFEICAELFDGGNAEAVADARRRWREYKDAGHAVTYWQQNERGGWEQKA